MAAWIAEEDPFDDFTFKAPLVADIVLAGDEALTGKEYYFFVYVNLSENYVFVKLESYILYWFVGFQLKRLNQSDSQRFLKW